MFVYSTGVIDVPRQTQFSFLLFRLHVRYKTQHISTIICDRHLSIKFEYFSLVSVSQINSFYKGNRQTLEMHWRKEISFCTINSFNIHKCNLSKIHTSVKRKEKWTSVFYPLFCARILAEGNALSIADNLTTKTFR